MVVCCILSVFSWRYRGDACISDQNTWV